MFSSYMNNKQHLIRDLHQPKIKKLHMMAPNDGTEKLANKGKTKLEEAMHNYNLLREAIDKDIEYSISHGAFKGKTKEPRKRFKIT